MYKVLLIFLASLVTSCQQTTAVNKNADSLNREARSITKNQVNIFADSNFTFIEIDSLSEDMLRNTEAGKSMYRREMKKLKDSHYEFFKYRGVKDTFFEEYYFLISRQKAVGEIKPIIVHTCTDFDYYTSELFTLDNDYNKIDSLIVSHSAFSTGGDEGPSEIEESWSKFKNNLITTTSLTYHKFDRDSIVTVDSTVVYRQIQDDGHIKRIDPKGLSNDYTN